MGTGGGSRGVEFRAELPKSRRRCLLRLRSIALLTAWLLCAPEVFADPPRTVGLSLVVTRISDEPGRIDPRASKIHRKLQREFRYQSLEVVQSVNLSLGIDEVGGLVLPTGKHVRVKPVLVDDRGALLAVEVEGMVQTDLRVKSGHMVIIGAQRQGNHRLVISLDPHF